MNKSTTSGVIKYHQQKERKQASATTEPVNNTAGGKYT